VKVCVKVGSTGIVARNSSYAEDILTAINELLKKKNLMIEISDFDEEEDDFGEIGTVTLLEICDT